MRVLLVNIFYYQFIASFGEYDYDNFRLNPTLPQLYWL